MLRWLTQKLFQILGWQFAGDMPPHIKKAVLLIAPHTSNWDGVYGLLFCFLKRLPIKFAIKKEAMLFPLGPIFKWMGAVPIDRKSGYKTHTNSVVQHMITMLRQHDALMLVIAPEGTRSRVKRWRRGFYHIASQAGVPIVLGYIDYAKKHIGVGPVIHPTGHFDSDLQRIQAFYKDKAGKYPMQGM